MITRTGYRLYFHILLKTGTQFVTLHEKYKTLKPRFKNVTWEKTNEKIVEVNNTDALLGAVAFMPFSDRALLVDLLQFINLHSDKPLKGSEFILDRTDHNAPTGNGCKGLIHVVWNSDGVMAELINVFQTKDNDDDLLEELQQ